VIPHDSKNVLSARLPVRLEVGESATWLMPFERGGFLHEGVDRYGVMDSFGQMHWVSSASLRAAINEAREAFGKPELRGST
jgi:hypothetical protein